MGDGPERGRVKIGKSVLCSLIFPQWTVSCLCLVLYTNNAKLLPCLVLMYIYILFCSTIYVLYLLHVGWFNEFVVITLLLYITIIVMNRQII